MRGTPRELRDVQEFLHKIESVSTRQVVLEAKILEVDAVRRHAGRHQLGSTSATRPGRPRCWAFQTGPQQGFGSNTFSSNTSLLNQPSTTVGLTPGSSDPISGAVTNTLGGAFAVAVTGANFATYIELWPPGNTRVLSARASRR